MEENKPEHQEQERTVETAWVFDVDGVISNPQEKKVTESEILDHIAQKLEAGEPVAFNTGRSIPWVLIRVINPLLEIISDKKYLANLFTVGEKGGTWLTFKDDGTIEHSKNKSISVPQSLQQQVERIVETEYADSMFYDQSKETMISIEMKDGYDVKEYRKRQEVLSKILQDLIEQESLAEQLKIDPTTIATDVQNMHVGKDFAAERISRWFEQKGIKPQKVFAVGDSPSDIAMAEKFHEKGYQVEFGYVGTNKLPKENYSFAVTRTDNKFDKGAVEFLRRTSPVQG